jgi:hypothetical protein
MTLAIRPAIHGQQRSLRRIRQVLRRALARSPGPHRLAWARLAAFCGAGLLRLVRDDHVAARALIALVAEGDQARGGQFARDAPRSG